MDFLEYLAQEVEKTGHPVKRDESSFFVEPVKLKVEAEINDRREHRVNGEYSVVFNLTIKATNEEVFPEGIYDCTVGIGGSDKEAFEYAAQNWSWTIFVLIHEILVPTETKDFNVPRLDLVTRNLDTGEEFAWKLFLGELQFSGEFIEQKDRFEETILVQKLLSAISAVTIEKRLFWIKIYISKLSETEIIGDCWLNNLDWSEGLNSIYQFAEEWTDVKSYAALKQFVIIKPCEMSELKNPEKIRESLPPASKPGFFRRLFGRN